MIKYSSLIDPTFDQHSYVAYATEICTSFCTWLALCTTTNNSVETVSISYKSEWYTFDKSAVKIDRRALFPSTHLQLVIL